MDKPEPTLLDRIEAGLLSRDDLQQEVTNQVYAGLYQYCQIPEGYRHCELATRKIDLAGLDEASMRSLLRNPPAEIVNPYPSQVKAIELFEMLLSGDSLVSEHGDPLSPTVGAYLYGPPGSGKTHLMAAFGRRVKERLDGELADVKQMMGDVLDQAYARYSERNAAEYERDYSEIGYLKLTKDGVRKDLSPSEEFRETLEQFKERVKEHRYQPTDMIYIGFKELYEVCKYSSDRNNAMLALEQARIVFIDDVHPQGDPEQIQLVLHLLERRYELGRAGTFITTNLDTKDLGGGDEMLGSRLLSRCAETLVTIDFSDCDDWRRKVKSQRVKMVEDRLDELVRSHRDIDDADDGKE